MKIDNDMVVSMHYVLTDENNDPIESTEDGELFSYLHGHDNVIRGLEAGLAGLAAGEKIHLTIMPRDAYGVRDPEAVFDVERDQFSEDMEIAPGVMVYGETEHGPQPYRVLAVTDSHVTLDSNHPLAGEILHYDVEVIEVRPATPEELAHGHSHDGDHAHH